MARAEAVAVAIACAIELAVAEALPPFWMEALELAWAAACARACTHTGQVGAR